MRTIPRLLALSLLALATAACSAEINAVVGAGSVSLTPAGGESAAVSGPVSFVDGTTLQADAEGARVRVALGGSVAGETTTGGDPAAGIVDFDLTNGSKLRRRAAAMFDLDEGIAHVRGGPMRMRVVVFHGTCFAEILPENNTEGVSVHLITQGD